MSLRLRLTLALILVNAVVLGTVAAWTSQLERRLRELEAEEASRLQLEVAHLVQGRFRPEDVGNLARMLSWPLWFEFEDAVVLDTRVVRVDGEPHPVGAFLNPRGVRQRPADFPMREVAEAVDRAARSGETVPVAGGVAMPLYGRSEPGEPAVAWGGVYLQFPRPAPVPALTGRVLLVGVVATLIGAFLVFLLVDRGVLRPVLALSRSAEAFGRGEDLPPPTEAHAREVRVLQDSFAAMVAEIRGFQAELEERVARATERARASDRRAERQERLAAVGMLAAGLAHEINSPLAGSLHALEVLREHAGDDPRAARYADLAEEALQRIRELVQRLLLLAADREVEGVTDLRALAEDLRAFLAGRLEQHRLELELAPGPLRVRGDRAEWFGLLLNLLRNALDALDEAWPEGGGTVHLVVSPEGDDRLRIEVRDDGPGAPAEVLPHLFEPFVTGKEVGRGVGLGLALVHAAVRRLGGTLEAGNLARGGFRVVLVVPIGEEGASPPPAGREGAS